MPEKRELRSPNSRAMRSTYENHCPEYYAGVSGEQWNEWELKPRYICIFCQREAHRWYCRLCKEYKGVMPYFPHVDYGFGTEMLE